MALAYKTPGVYIEEISKFPPSIAAVETAIPAFIGYTEKAINSKQEPLTLIPTRITSLVEYEELFGGAQAETNIKVTINETQAADGKTIALTAKANLAETGRSKHILYYALQMFFANGGGPCYIVSVGVYKNLGEELIETELQAGLPKLEKVDEPTLIVFPEAQLLKNINDFKALHDAALAQCELLKDRFVIMDLHGALSDSGSAINTIVSGFRTNGIGTSNLKYGAAYAPNLETVLDFLIDESKIETTINITKPSEPAPAPAPAILLNTLQQGDNRKYELAKSAIRDLSCKLPPSSTMAGVYASVDSSRGVWKAPANISLNAVIKPTIEISNREQGDMNIDPTAGKSINVIRSFTGKGTLVWGARTLAGNDNEWRYVSVRRLFNFVEESVKKATEQFVFEPNDANTWVKVQAMIENFLTTLWRQGALQGVKPEHAFYVSVGLGKTMTALDILEGRLIIAIGLAAVRPAEFIIIRFSHKMAES